MRGLIALFLACLYLAFSAEPAGAAVVGAVVAKVGAFVAAASSTTFGAILVRTVVAVGVSLVQQKLAKKRLKDQKDPGIQTNQTTSGGTEPQATVLGWSSTGGHLVYHNSHGDKNKYYQMVIEVSDLPGLQLSALYLDGEKCTLGGTHASFGQEITNKRNGSSARAWIKYYDGTQTAADAMLVNRYGSDPDRPWTANHKLIGICYAILTFLYDRKTFPSDPQAVFELHGGPFYDPRKDTTAGGSGSHRWGQPATYETTTNPIVIAYNILRGITLPDGNVWGGRAEAEDVPLDNWVPAMNTCDAVVDGRPRFRFGMEIALTEQPRDIVKEAMASCNGQIAEIGGIYKVMVAEPAPALAIITDEDVLVSEPSERDPFPGVESTFNAIVATHPAPEALWNQSQLPVIAYPEWEAEDGGRRLLTVSLPGVPWTSQGQQVADTMLKDERRFLRHRNSLPPDFDWIEPLMTLGWDSEWNGYDAKLFEVAEVAYDLKRLIPTVSLRERDPDDAAHVPGLELPDTPGITTPIVRIPQPVPGFDLLPVTIDVAGQTRRPALMAVWDVEDLGDVEGITIELRLAGETAIVWQQTVTDVASGEKVIEPVLPAQGYEGRARVYSTAADMPWGAWEAALTSDVKFGTPDLEGTINQAIADGAQAKVDLVNLRGGYAGTLPDIVDEMENVSLVAARLSSGGMALNPAFTAWAGAWPDGWRIAADAGEAFAKVAEGEYGHAVDLFADPAATSNYGPNLSAFLAQDGNRGVPASLVERVLVTLEVELLYGTWSGAHIAVAWIGDQLVLAQVPLDQGQLTETIGVRQRVQVFLDRPETFALGLSNEIKLDLVANSATGGGYADKGIRVHAFDIEAINAESLAGIIQQVQVRQDLQSSLLALQAVAGEAEGTVQIVAQDDGEAPYSKVIIDGDFFELRGNALFGDDVEVEGSLITGQIASPNYIPGSQGWSIDLEGNAEFNNMIARSSIIDGAVSDGGDGYYSGTGTFSNYQHILSITIDQPITPDTIMTFGFLGQHKRAGSWTESNKAGTTTYLINTKFFVRLRQKWSSGWGSWTVIHESSRKWDTSWTERRWSGSDIYNNEGLQLAVGIDIGVEVSGSGSVDWGNNPAPTESNARRVGLVLRSLPRR